MVSEDGSARSSSDVATGGVGNMASAMERHIQQTNERLHCMKEVGTLLIFHFGDIQISSKNFPLYNGN